jgi:phage-related minor tail protein
VAAGLRAGVAYVDVEGRLSRDFDRNLESEAGGRMGGIGGKLGGLLAAGLAGAGIAAGAALTKGIFDAVGQEAGTDRLAAQLGIDNPDYAADLGEIAGDLYADNFGSSVADANAALREVLGQGLLPEDATNEQIERITGKVMNLTDVFEQDLPRAGQAVSAMLKNGLAPDADAAIDVLTRGFQQGVNEADDLLDTMNEYSPLFARLGIDAAAATGLLSQGLQAGARDSDTVADALKEFQIRATDASTLSAEGFKMLGLNAAEMTAQIAKGGPEASAGLDLVLDRLRATEDPVKRNAAAVALFGTKAEDLGESLFALDPSTAVAGLGNIGGAAERMGETLSGNTAAKIETFKRQALQGLADFVGQYVIPAVERFVPVIVGVVDAVVAKWPEIQAAILPIVEAIVAFVTERWPQIAETVTAVLDDVLAVVSGVLELVAILWDTFGDRVLEFVTATFAAVLQQIEGALNIIRGIVDLVLGLLTGDWRRAWDGIKGIVSGVWQVITGLVDEAIAKVKLVVGVGLDALKLLVSAPLEAIKRLFSSAWDGIKGAVSGAFDGIKSAVSSGIDTVVGFVRDLPGRVVAVARGAFDGIKDAFRSAINWIIRGWNRLEFRVPGFKVGPIGYDGFTLGLPNVPELAEGGTFSGLALVGEEGPELVHRAGLTRVRANHDLAGMIDAAVGSSSSRTGPVVQFGDVHLSDEVDVDLLGRRLEFSIEGVFQ